MSFRALTQRALALARRQQPLAPPPAPRHQRTIASIISARRTGIDAPSSSSPSFAFADGADADADAALARRRAVFLAPALAGSNNSKATPTPPYLHIWRVGIDEPRLLKALEGAGFAGRVLVCPSASGGVDAVLAVPRKAAGRRQGVDLAAARSAARNARAAFVLLRATTARAVFEALAPMVAQREVFGEQTEEDEEEQQGGGDERVAAAVERLRRAAPALRPTEEEQGRDDDKDGDVGFTRVPTLRAVAAAAAAAAASPPSSAPSALRLLGLLTWSEDVAARLPPRAEASRRPLLTPPRAARLPEPAWLWLGTAGAAAAVADGEEEGGKSTVGKKSGGKSDDEDLGGRAAMVPRNRDARADAAFRVTRDDGGPLQPGAPGDAKRRRLAQAERRRRRRGGGEGGALW